MEHDMTLLSDWYKANQLLLNINKRVLVKSRPDKPFELKVQQKQSPGQVMAGRRTWAPVAQMVEHLTRNWEVVGSMPTWVSLTFFQHSLA